MNIIALQFFSSVSLLWCGWMDPKYLRSKNKLPSFNPALTSTLEQGKYFSLYVARMIDHQHILMYACSAVEIAISNRTEWLILGISRNMHICINEEGFLRKRNHNFYFVHFSFWQCYIFPRIICTTFNAPGWSAALIKRFAKKTFPMVLLLCCNGHFC